MTLTLTDEVLQLFQDNELSAYQAYQSSLKDMVGDGGDLSTSWHDTADLRHDWRLAYADWKRALAATPCFHAAAERHNQAQRCDWCWMISTYIRLTTPKENDNE